MLRGSLDFTASKHLKGRFLCLQGCGLLWKAISNGKWGAVIWVLYNSPFIMGNWVVFLKVTTWLSKLNITNKAQPLCPFCGASRRIRHFLQRGNWQTAMIITEALSVLSSSPGHTQALILSFPSPHLHSCFTHHTRHPA